MSKVRISGFLTIGCGIGTLRSIIMEQYFSFFSTQIVSLLVLMPAIWVVPDPAHGSTAKPSGGQYARRIGSYMARGFWGRVQGKFILAHLGFHGTSQYCFSSPVSPIFNVRVKRFVVSLDKFRGFSRRVAAVRHAGGSQRDSVKIQI